MKKFLPAIALSLAAALGLAACGSAPTEDTGGTADFKACMVSDEGGFDDQSFNQSGMEGLERAKTELGVQINKAESKSDSDYQTNVDAMVQDGCDLIIGVGFKLATVLTDSAKAHPDIQFALVDSAFTDNSGAVVEIDNGRPLIFNTAEAAYLAGYVAAGTSASGKVATYGGMEIPTVQIFMEGFAQGVAKYNEDNGTSVEVLGWNSETKTGSFVGDFSSTDKGQTLTEGFIAQGADVIMPVAGPVGSGTLSAVAAASNGADIKVIWVDSDGFLTTGDSHILTSVMKEIDVAVYDTVKAASEGNFTSDSYIGTLANEGVGLAPYHDLDASVPQDLKDKVVELQTQIANGTLTVTTPYDPTN